MKRLPFALACAAVFSLAASRAQDAGEGIPWFAFGPVDTVYVLSIDTTVAFRGQRSLRMQSLPGASVGTWIASQQIVHARTFHGRRVRIRARVRTQDASAAGMWLVIDGVASRKPATLLLDTLTPHLRGTTAWREVVMVFDVSPSAQCIRYGSTLRGSGAIWMDAIVFEVVGSEVAVTKLPLKPPRFTSDDVLSANCRNMISSPTNLDFEESPR